MLYRILRQENLWDRVNWLNVFAIKRMEAMCAAIAVCPILQLVISHKLVLCCRSSFWPAWLLFSVLTTTILQID